MSEGGVWIREARNKQGLSQTELGQRIGVTQAQISQWENGKATPSMAQLSRLRTVLNLAGADSGPVSPGARETPLPRSGSAAAAASVELSDLGDWIRDRRNALGMSQTTLAGRVGANQNTVSRWETGKAIPDEQQLAALRRVLAGQSPEQSQLALPGTTEKASRLPEPAPVASPSRISPPASSPPPAPSVAPVPPAPPRTVLPARASVSLPAKEGSSMTHFSEKVSFIWSVADLLRGDYKQSEYGRVILPFLVLRRLDQVLAPTRKAVLEADARYPADRTPEALREQLLLKAAGETFYNTSKLDFGALLDDANNAAANLTGYVHGFSRNVRDIMDKFRFEEQIARLDAANLLFLVLKKFVAVDLDPFRRNPDGSPAPGPDGKPVPHVTNIEMGYVFEELIRKFSEQSNETAGEHFTPREVIRFMVTLLFAEDDEVLHKPGIVRTMYDPACGTGGMLSVAEEHLSRLGGDPPWRI